MDGLDSNNKNNLKLAIFKAVVWFDLFDYPLTAYEIWQYLPFKIPLAELIFFLKSGSSKESTKTVWAEKNGFYFLPGRDSLLSVRQDRYNQTDRKFKIALRVTACFRFLPFVRLVAVANLIGSHNLRQGSDIDLFIIASPKRLWLARFFCAGLAKVLNLRPNKKTKQDKICLSFYVSEDRLNLEDLRLDDNDFYFNHWLAGLIPIYDQGGVYEEFCQANAWLKAIFPNLIWPDNHPRRQKTARHLFSDSRFFDSWERIAHAWQLKILPAALKELANQDSRVIVNNEVIKLYLVDRRAELKDKFLEKLKIYESA